MDSEQVAALTVVVVAFVIISIGIVIIIRTKRRETKENDDKAKQEQLDPPLHTITLSSSNFTGKTERSPNTGEGTEGPQVLNTISSGDDDDAEDVWKLREDDRRDYIMSRILHDSVDTKICKVLDLPHVAELSRRGSVISSTSIEEQKTQSLESSIGKMGLSKTDDIEVGHTHKQRSKESLYATDASTLSAPATLEAAQNYTHYVCSICNEEYRHGDKICWSRNENCVHAFHLECKIQYLLNTDECILCRHDFLRKHISEMGDERYFIRDDSLHIE